MTGRGGMNLSRQGLFFGLVGMVMFALTLPLTKLAVLAFDPWLVTFGRAVAAALFGAVFLRSVGARLPHRKHWGALCLVVVGNVVGFPLLLALALTLVPANHAAVITGLLPLTTAIFAVILTKERPSFLFWIAALAGSALVLAFALHRGAGHLVAADGLLLLAMILASVGYVAGAKLTPALGGLETMSWALVAALPFTLPVTAYVAYQSGLTAFASAPWSAWLGFAYVSVFSMFIGFWFWFRGLHFGGAARVGQVQLLQPFISIFASALILSEALTLDVLAFVLAVMLCVLVGVKTRQQTLAVENAS
jgi:drug/metabolite transporter (DMT)-like permease